MYGYQEVEERNESGASLVFGVNTGAYLKEFGFNPNGGTGGSEMDVLDIVFEIQGKRVSYRQFPITQAFLKDGSSTKDPKTVEFQNAVKEQSARIIQLIECFVPKKEVQEALEGVKSFKQFCSALKKALPEDYDQIELHVFMEHGSPTNDGKVYLEIPKKSTHGRIFTNAKGLKGPWSEVITTNNSIHFVNEEGKEHPFKRSSWYMKNYKGYKKPLEKTINKIEDIIIDDSNDTSWDD